MHDLRVRVGISARTNTRRCLLRVRCDLARSRKLGVDTRYTGGTIVRRLAAIGALIASTPGRLPLLLDDSGAVEPGRAAAPSGAGAMSMATAA